MVDHIVIMSLDAASLHRMHELRPTWTIGRLTAVPITDLTREQVDFLAVSRRMATPDFIRRAHYRGKEVYVWTINDAPDDVRNGQPRCRQPHHRQARPRPRRARPTREHGPDRPAGRRDRRTLRQTPAAHLSRRGAVVRVPRAVANAAAACNRWEKTCRKTIVELPTGEQL